MRHISIFLAMLFIGNQAFSAPCTEPGAKPGFEVANKKLMNDLKAVLSNMENRSIKVDPTYSITNFKNSLAKADASYCVPRLLDCSSCDYYLRTIRDQVPSKYREQKSSFTPPLNEQRKNLGEATRELQKMQAGQTGKTTPKLGSRTDDKKAERCLALEKNCIKDPKSNLKCKDYGPIGKYYMNCLADPRS